jgi:hypothetical protein
MRKILAAGAAALTLGGAMAAAAVPATAQAREWHGGHHGGGHAWRGHGGWDHHYRGGGGATIAAGIAGLAIGAALADSGPRYYGGYGYSYGYPGYYGYDYGPAVCETSRWVWDPYIGRRVLVRQHYPC